MATTAGYVTALWGIFQQQLANIGFVRNPLVGQQLLPAIIGKVTRFNANGGYTLNKVLPKETLTRSAEITDWHHHTHTVYITYQRYRRIPIPAPGVELLVRNDAGNNKILVSPLFTKNANTMDDVKHAINMFLEIFGECEILLPNLMPAFNVQVTRLNWTLLPAGNYPWQVLAPHVRAVIAAASRGQQNIITQRITRISNHNPSFVAVGTAGFRGYMVFGGFPNKNFFVLESIYTGNATYVLGQNWQQISQLTKDQILNQNLQQQRLVHSAGWDAQIDNLLR